MGTSTRVYGLFPSSYTGSLPNKANDEIYRTNEIQITILETAFDTFVLMKWTFHSQ